MSAGTHEGQFPAEILVILYRKKSVLAKQKLDNPGVKMTPVKFACGSVANKCYSTEMKRITYHVNQFINERIILYLSSVSKFNQNHQSLSSLSDEN